VPGWPSSLARAGAIRSKPLTLLKAGPGDDDSVARARVARNIFPKDPIHDVLNRASRGLTCPRLGKCGIGSTAFVAK
jgi:hypothetical protein